MNPTIRPRAAVMGFMTAMQFDVLVSDIGLPDGSGTELLKMLRSKHQIFGIALSGYGMEEDVRRSRDVGFSYHLVKPVDLNKLDSLIQLAPLGDRTTVSIPVEMV
jgi:CheY-like chemotaxis protein